MYDFYPVDDEYYMGTGSVNDCTGLIPAGISEEEEAEFYEQLYPYMPVDVEEYVD